MTKKSRILVFTVTVALATSPVMAGYKLMAAGKPVTVAKSGLMVSPSQDWNRLGARPGRNAESWTLDGLLLNDVTFYGGIADNTTLFREVDKKNRPLPRFSKTMLPTDIPQLFEGSYRVANGTALMSVDKIEPATFAGKSGVRFAYSFTVQGEEVKRKGEATGAIVDGRLYMISYEAPVIHYYNRDLESYRKLVSSAVIGAKPKKK
ncbi:MAG: hypothetical protein ACRCY3_00090 [Sphingorhabdus sp.]